MAVLGNNGLKRWLSPLPNAAAPAIWTSAAPAIWTDGLNDIARDFTPADIPPRTKPGDLAAVLRGARSPPMDYPP
jgi:hypothetical protein